MEQSKSFGKIRLQLYNNKKKLSHNNFHVTELGADVHSLFLPADELDIASRNPVATKHKIRYN